MRNSTMNTEIKSIAKRLSSALPRWNDSKDGLIRRATVLVSSYLDGKCESNLVQSRIVGFVFTELSYINNDQYRRMFPLVQWDENGNKYYA